MFQHLSKGDLVTGLTERAQSRVELFKGIGGRLVLSLRYLFETEVHAYALMTKRCTWRASGAG